MSRTTPVLLATTAVSLIVSGYLWLELNAERGQVRRNQANELTQRLQEPARPTGSSRATPAPQDMQPGVAPPVFDASAEAAPSLAVLSDSMRKQLLAMEFTRPHSTLEAARRTIARAYPELRTGAGLSDEEVETLAGLMARGAYPEESEKALGASAYQRWMDYRRTIDANRSVENLQKRVPDAPLSEDQGRALARVFQDEQRWHDEQSPRVLPAASDPRSKMENELRAARLEMKRRANVIDRARAFLTAPQIAALQKDPYAELRAVHLAALEEELGGEL